MDWRNFHTVINVTIKLPYRFINDQKTCFILWDCVKRWWQYRHINLFCDKAFFVWWFFTFWQQSMMLGLQNNFLQYCLSKFQHKLIALPDIIPLASRATAALWDGVSCCYFEFCEMVFRVVILGLQHHFLLLFNTLIESRFSNCLIFSWCDVERLSTCSFSGWW